MRQKNLAFDGWKIHQQHVIKSCEMWVDIDNIPFIGTKKIQTTEITSVGWVLDFVTDLRFWSSKTT